VKLWGRGLSEPVEVPDQPTAPTLPTGTAVARGGEAPAQTQAASDHGAGRADSASAPVALTTFDATPSAPATLSFAHTEAPVQFLTVASAVTEIHVPAMMRGDLGGSTDASGGGEIARGSDTLASLELDGAAYADHGWFVVPSASNEYGPAYAAADGFAFDVAAGEFSSDWFWA
jgi:hypothetical protein